MPLEYLARGASILTRRVMLNLLWGAVATALLPAPAAGQQPPPTPQKPVEGAAAQQPQPPRQPAMLANVKLDLTITDQRGDAAAAPKMVTIVVADRENGRIRTGRAASALNVDL